MVQKVRLLTNPDPGPMAVQNMHHWTPSRVRSFFLRSTNKTPCGVQLLGGFLFYWFYPRWNPLLQRSRGKAVSWKNLWWVLCHKDSPRPCMVIHLPTMPCWSYSPIQMFTLEPSSTGDGPISNHKRESTISVQSSKDSMPSSSITPNTVLQWEQSWESVQAMAPHSGSLTKWGHQ